MGCITDPLAKAWWRDYRKVCRGGNSLGLSFVEYVAHRVASLGPRVSYESNTADSPWYPATCGHHHPWGQACGHELLT